MSESARRQTPTEGMLRYANTLAKELNLALPPEVEQDFDACRAFLDEHADQVPPSEKQVAYAERLADASGESIPDDVLSSKKKLSAWIDEHAVG